MHRLHYHMCVYKNILYLLENTFTKLLLCVKKNNMCVKRNKRCKCIGSRLTVRTMVEMFASPPAVCGSFVQTVFIARCSLPFANSHFPQD